MTAVTNEGAPSPQPKPWQHALQRASDILLRPQSTWAAIDQEEGDTIAAIYRRYLLMLAAIPAVAAFIGQSLIGFSLFGVTVRTPILQGLVGMVVSYTLMLAMVYVVALVANALAPKFQGQPHPLKAFQLIAYGATAGMLGGVFSVLPALSMLGLLAGLYAIYLIYRGVPVLMRVPAERVLGYTAALVVCALVAGLLLGLVSSLFVPSAASVSSSMTTPSITARTAGRGGEEVKIQVPGTNIQIDTQRVEAAARKMQEAQARGETQAATQAMGDALGAALGGQGAAPLPPQTLRAQLPDALGRLARTSIEARSDRALGLQLTTVKAEYTAGDRSVRVTVKDLGAMPALISGIAAWAQSSVDRDAADSAERIYRADGVAYRVSYRKDGSHAEQTMLLPNGVLVEAEGNLPFDDLSAALSQLPLQAMATLPRPS